MRRLFSIFLFSIFIFVLFAQNGQKGEARATNRTVLIKIDGSQGGNAKADNDNSVSVISPVTGLETVNFSSSSEGIYINIVSGTNRIKLLALTGQQLFYGDLKQGRFFISVRKGIYFLTINNNPYKVICK